MDTQEWRSFQERDDIAVVMRDAGHTYRQIGQALGCAHQTVLNILRRRGVYKPTRGLSLTEDQQRHILCAYAPELTAGQIAEAVGIPIRQVRACLYAHGLRVHVINPDVDWTDAETAFLRAHYKVDMSGQQIADHLGRSRNSVIGKAQRIGLNDRAHRTKGRLRRRLREQSIWTLRQRGATLSEIAAILDCPLGTTTAYLTSARRRYAKAAE